MKVLLRGISQLFFVVAALSFFVGGRALTAFTQTDRITAEIAGISIAFVFGLLGAVLKSAGHNMDEEQG